MRVTRKDLKHGEIKLVAETLDDMWHLQHIISPGNVVTSFTWRREPEADDKLRPERREKRRVKLSIRVEDIEFHKHANRLRLLGIIVSGPDVGKHHSFNVELGSEVAIVKEWRADDLRRIKDAVRASRRPRVLLVALDDSSAELALVRQYGLDGAGSISRPSMGKRYAVESEADEKKFFSRVAEAIRDIISRENVRAVIVAGPGFTKQKFAAFLRERFQELSEVVRLGEASSGGHSGLYEIVRRGLVERVTREDRLSLEMSLIEELLREISKDGLGAYGRLEIENAASMGAIKKLLVADELLRLNRSDVKDILEKARRTSAEVLVISTEHDAGRQLMALGGIAALLRFRPR